MTAKQRQERLAAIEAFAATERAVLSYGERHTNNPGALIPLANKLHSLMIRFERTTHKAEQKKR